MPHTTDRAVWPISCEMENIAPTVTCPVLAFLLDRVNQESFDGFTLRTFDPDGSSGLSHLHPVMATLEALGNAAEPTVF